MRKVLLAAFSVLLVLPVVASAQVVIPECWGCELGIYTDTDLEQNFMFWDPNPQDPTTIQRTIYVGIRYDPASGLSGLTGIELSIDFGGLDQLVTVTATELDFPAVTIGTSYSAPADTVNNACTLTQPCGKNVTWAACNPGSRALVQLSMIGFVPIPDNTVLRVLRRFPSTTPLAVSQLLTQCDENFTLTKISAGCFVLNPTGGPGDTIDNCLLKTPVAPTTWSGIKSLYR